MVFEEVISVYSKNHIKPINTKREISAEVKVGGTYTHHWALKGLSLSNVFTVSGLQKMFSILSAAQNNKTSLNTSPFAWIRPLKTSISVY
jgi:hypothetical protein